MNILLLAPHPFYQERGTPIATRLLTRALVGDGHQVDILTYHEGDDVETGDQVRIRRIRAPRGATGIRPGFSLKKVLCDLYMYPEARRMMQQKPYDVIHAIEESVFMAMALGRRFNTPYIFDMDSSMPQQLVEKHAVLKIFAPVFRWFEKRAIRKAACVVPVCDAIAELARFPGGPPVFILRDVPLTGTGIDHDGEPPELAGCGIRFMYIGNLEAYQGIDLLLESFDLLLEQTDDACLTVVGGAAADVAKYRVRVAGTRLGAHVQFTGPVAVGLIDKLLTQADVLVSPRIKGVNTPMKIYSYLMSGKPVLATDIASHTQVIPREVAVLTPPEAEAMAEGMRQLADSENLRDRCGRRGRELAQTAYSFDAFKQQVRRIYASLPSSASNA